MKSRIHRRKFLRHSVFSVASLYILRPWAALARPLSPNERLNIGALCDVDEKFLAAAHQKFPAAREYSDFRRLLEQKDIDAVVIATPDHTHAVATAAALESGRHVYCEKPLTRTLSDCRAVTELARRHKRITQIGTQIRSGANYHRVVELIQQGAVGPVNEVHVWVSATYGGKG